MPSNRIGRINEELQRELAALLRRLKDPRVSQTGMVSVTRVDTTGDLRYAKVYVSVLDKSQEKEVLKGLKSASGFLRRELGQALQLRHTPELQFIGDDSIRHGAHILEMLRQVEREDSARKGGSDPNSANDNDGGSGSDPNCDNDSGSDPNSGSDNDSGEEGDEK